jgi:site-specific DNA-methyltransferase (adenine-specific)
MPKSIVECCDNMEFMRVFPDKFFDLNNPDPPYFSGPEKRRFYGQQFSSKKVKRIDYPVTSTWDLPSDKTFEEIFRVSKNQIVWGANYFPQLGPVHKTPRQSELDQWLSDHPTGWIVWDKCNGTSSFNDFELAWTSYDTPTVIFKFMWNGMLQGKSLTEGYLQKGDKTKNQKRIHPTEKPFELYKWTFKNYLTPEMKVIDPYLGSQASRIVAYDMGIDFYGCETDPTHFSTGCNRFNQHIKQLNLFQPEQLTV